MCVCVGGWAVCVYVGVGGVGVCVCSGWVWVCFGCGCPCMYACVGVGVGMGMHVCVHAWLWVCMYECGCVVCPLSLPVFVLYRMSVSVRLMSTTGWSASGSVAMRCLSQPSTSTPG